jgi:glycosyltransferase involved in cell wall biosynthesis
MNFLFLYTELAEYTLACIKELANQRKGDQIMVIHFPINKEAPFRFDLNFASFYSIDQFATFEALEEKVTLWDPQMVVCSGWIHPYYTRLCKKKYKRTVTVLALDNHWNGSLKQWIFALFSRFTLSKWYHYAWVPGTFQFRYAQKLGFKQNRIRMNFYCCDTDRFLAIGNQFKEKKEQSIPRVLLCVARYIPAKGYEQLWDAFIRWQSKQEQDWELWCAGTGDDFDKRRIHPKIKHLGFVQKEEWTPIIERTGIFVLFSHFEPWGVVVHEFAAAGYPLLLSDKVGAGEKFLTVENGWFIDIHNATSIDQALDEIGCLTQQSYNQMALRSRDLAQTLRPIDWVKTFESML